MLKLFYYELILDLKKNYILLLIWSFLIFSIIKNDDIAATAFIFISIPYWISWILQSKVHKLIYILPMEKEMVKNYILSKSFIITLFNLILCTILLVVVYFAHGYKVSQILFFAVSCLVPMLIISNYLNVMMYFQGKVIFQILFFINVSFVWLYSFNFEFQVNKVTIRAVTINYILSIILNIAYRKKLKEMDFGYEDNKNDLKKEVGK